MGPSPHTSPAGGVTYIPCSEIPRASGPGGAGVGALGCPRAPGGGAGMQVPWTGPSPRGSLAGGTLRTGRSHLPYL